MPKECNSYISNREQTIFLMLIHHILTMVSIQYEPIISIKLNNLIINLAEDLQRLPIAHTR